MFILINVNKPIHLQKTVVVIVVITALHILHISIFKNGARLLLTHF